MATVEEFAAKAWEHRGAASFEHRGREISACDCIGFPLAICAMLGVEVPPFTDYARNPDSEVLLKAVRERCDERPWSEWDQVGRLAVLKHGRLGPKHFGITSGDGIILQMARMVKTIDIREDLSRLHSVWVIRGLTI